MYYVLFAAVWLVIATIILYAHLIHRKELHTIRRFPSGFFNIMYQLSFLAPFKWFVEDDLDLTKKGEHMKMLLHMSRFNKRFTVRSFMAFHFSLLIGAILLSIVVIYLIPYTSTIFSVVFNIETNANGPGDVSTGKSLLVFLLFLVLAMYPKFHLKNKAKKELVGFNKELPMIQMFVILMLKSNKTVREVLFALSKLNTYHRETFEQGYRIYARNPIEGMRYLKGEFTTGRFSELFDLLEDIGEYAKNETVTILEGNMRSLTDETNDVKRKNDIKQMVFSQFSMGPPFAALLLLGIVPIIISGINSFSSSSLFGF
ncbi:MULTISPECIES: hypothetical protein [unclassified Psychrobacillus]|uniref:hypothetical protein n=1 Tax=unclassified Psychrobacillus TaxID=2636677 RepID=UPI0030F93B90